MNEPEHPLIPLNDNELVQLQANAALMFTIKEIATILQLDPAELKCQVNKENTPEFASFQRGRLEAEGKIRQSIFDLALNGSSPAQSQFLQLIENSKLDDAL